MHRRPFFRVHLMIALLVFSLSVSSFTATVARADERDYQAIKTTAIYGTLGGATLGTALWPLTGSIRSIFIGASVGLYLGILIGIYHIGHRNDPNNPLRGGHKNQGLTENWGSDAPAVIESSESVWDPSHAATEPELRFAPSMTELARSAPDLTRDTPYSANTRPPLIQAELVTLRF